jgi:catechol 2,3-dioxygenase-like lactoylglutathione lyase family enzyme
VRVSTLDHLVLTVRDVERTIAFYSRVLGMEPVTFGAGRRALAFGSMKINLHQAGRELEPKAGAPLPGSADLCFLTDDSIDAVIATMAEHGVEIVEGPVRRTGALGAITSVYVRDPDTNLVEIGVYG